MCASWTQGWWSTSPKMAASSTVDYDDGDSGDDDDDDDGQVTPQYADDTLRDTRPDGVFATFGKWVRESFRDSSVVNNFMFKPPRRPSYHVRKPTAVAHHLHWVLIDDNAPGRGAFPVLVVSASPSATNIVFYMHGNSEDAGDVYSRAHCISEWTNAHVCVVEYPGYGPLSGHCTEGGAVLHAKRAIEDVVSRNNVSHAHVLIYGRSIGSGVTLSVVNSVDEQFGGFVLHSALLSVSDVVSAHSPAMGMLSSVFGGGLQFNNSEYVKRVRAPVLFVHGKHDSVIDKSHSERLYELCAAVEGDDKKLVIDDSGDHEVFDRQVLEFALRSFMNRVKSTRRAFELTTRRYDDHNLPEHVRRAIDDSVDWSKARALRSRRKQRWASA